MGNSKFEPPHGRGWTTGVLSRGYVENKGVSMAPQVGFEPTTLRLTASRLIDKNKRLSFVFCGLPANRSRPFTLLYSHFLSLPAKEIAKVNPGPRRRRQSVSEFFSVIPRYPVTHWPSGTAVHSLCVRTPSCFGCSHGRASPALVRHGIPCRIDVSRSYA